MASEKLHENGSGVEVALSARAATYRVLQNLLGNEPTIDAVSELTSDNAQMVLGTFSLGGDDGSRRYGEALDALVQNAQAVVADGSIGRVEDCFTRLFVGPGKPEAVPWASMCLTGDVALFQKSTLDVRNFYRSYGFVPRSYPHVADDHIALELDFMARMANRALQAIEAGDADEARAALDASHRFLTDFMLPWVPTFCKTVHAAEHSFFYSDVADVLEAFLPIDQALLKELLDGAFA